MDTEYFLKYKEQLKNKKKYLFLYFVISFVILFFILKVLVFLSVIWFIVYGIVLYRESKLLENIDSFEEFSDLPDSGLKRCINGNLEIEAAYNMQKKIKSHL